MDITYQAYWLRAYTEAQLLNQKEWQSYSNPCSTASIREGKLDKGIGTDTVAVMVAPFCAKNDKGELLVPIWLPARLLADGSLLPRHKGVSPFIPTRFFSPSVEGPKFGTLLMYDNYLNSQSVLQAPIAEEDWQALFIRGYHALNDIGGDWVSLFSECGYVQQNHGLVYQLESVDDAIQSVLAQNIDELSSLLQRWMSPEYEQSFSPEFRLGDDANIYKDSLGLYNSISPNVRQLLLQLSALKQGDVLAIAQPKGTERSLLLDNLYANHCVHSVLKALDTTVDATTVDATMEDVAPTLIVGATLSRFDKIAWLPAFEENTVTIRAEADYTDSSSSSIENYLIKAQHSFKDGFFNQYGTRFDTLDEYAQFLQQKLKTDVAYYQKASALFTAWVNATTDPLLQENLSVLQLEDEKLESEFEHLEKAKDIWEKRGSGHPWWMGLSFISSIKKKREARFSSFVMKCLVQYETDELKHWKDATEENVLELIQNRLRAIRARRTKIHVDLVPITEAIVAAGSNGRTFYDFVHQSVSSADSQGRNTLNAPSFIEMHEKRDNIRRQIFELAYHYQECIRLKASLASGNLIEHQFDGLHFISQLSDADLSIHYDKVIILDAHRYLPYELVALFNVSETAILIGDVASVEPLWPIPGHVDELWADSFELVNEEWDFEILQYKGGLASCGNALLLAKDICSYKQEKDAHLLPEATLSLFESHQSEAILSYANTYVYGGQLQSTSTKASNFNEHTKKTLESLAPISYIAVNGSSQLDAGNLYNEAEVDAVVQWINDHKIHPEAYYVLTLFASQATRIKAALHAKGLVSSSVYTLAEVPSVPREVVFFCGVYTPKETRPFAFDQGEQTFNTVFGSALHHVVIVADMMLFDPDTHSPSGQVAKTLFWDPASACASWTPSLSGEAIHLDKATLTKLFAKAKEDIWIYSTKTANDFLRRVDFEVIRDKIASGEIGVHLVTTEIDSTLQSSLVQLGFHLHIFPRLYTNLIVVDDHTYINIPYALFAESDALIASNPSIRSPKAQVKLLKQNLLDNLNAVGHRHFVKNYSVVET